MGNRELMVKRERDGQTDSITTTHQANAIDETSPKSCGS